ncbi:MAG: glycyl-radical enzyme activating protein [Deltaproteobacteria bacterium]|nr:glycyl-radical enzyme activating protein [Deltaproteobacteria bacterium]
MRERGPFIVDVRRNALDDGPGIRSVVFFKGCPLRCVWCQNPEALSPAPEIQRLPERCTSCGACAAACPEGIARPAAWRPGSGRCRLCGRCAAACSGAARRIAGRRHDVQELVELLCRDAVFYRRSGGGVTLSGGEPALFPVWTGRLAAALRERGVPVLLETCGHFGWHAFARHLLPQLSTIYFDLKLADEQAHRLHTGRGHRVIHRNLGRLVAAGFPDLLVRVPVVPGITDAEENLDALAALVRGLGLGRVALLAYNPLWIAKRRALGLALPYARAQWMSAAEIERCAAIFRGAGLEVTG